MSFGDHYRDDLRKASKGHQNSHSLLQSIYKNLFTWFDSLSLRSYWGAPWSTIITDQTISTRIKISVTSSGPVYFNFHNHHQVLASLISTKSMNSISQYSGLTIPNQSYFCSTSAYRSLVYYNSHPLIRLHTTGSSNHLSIPIFKVVQRSQERLRHSSPRPSPSPQRAALSRIGRQYCHYCVSILSSFLQASPLSSNDGRHRMNGASATRK